MELEKSGNSRLLIVVLVIIALGAAVALAFYDKSYNWYTHTYDRDDTEPYGADLTVKYLKSLRAAKDFASLDSSLATNLSSVMDSSFADNYIVFGFLPLIDSLDKEQLYAYAEKGNSVFLLTGAVNSQLLSEMNDGACVLYDESEDSYYDFQDLSANTVKVIEDTMVKVNLIHPNLRRSEDYTFSHHVKDELKRTRWPYMDSSYFCENNVSFTALGTVNDQVNFFRYPYGEGYFYFLTTPKILTNYYLLTPEGKEYADKIFAHLDQGKIIWDDKQWKAPKSPEYLRDRYYQSEGPLSYVLSQESLRWALYLVFAGVLLLLFIGTNRKQKAIPVIRPKENSSMEYVETIASLYFNQDGDGRIFRYLSDQFLFFIRERYRQAFKWKEEEWPLLAKASGISVEHIQKLSEFQKKGSYEPNVNHALLAEYYEMLDYFYSNCK